MSAPCTLVAEIGLNHNGSLDIAKRLMRKAKDAGWDIVKFQKRTISEVYTQEQLAAKRESPWGTTYGEYKYATEFGTDIYDEIHMYAKRIGIKWTASVWDVQSINFMMKYDPPFLKLPSCYLMCKSIIDPLSHVGVPVHISTGMATLPDITNAVYYILDRGVYLEAIYHCNSTYPTDNNEINLLGIKTLQDQFPRFNIGYSGHERGVVTSVFAAVLGATHIERHITLDRTMYGSDHAASLEPKGFTQLARDVRLWETCKGNGNIVITQAERLQMERLNRVNTL